MSTTIPELVRKPADNDFPIIDPLKERWSPLAFAPTPLSHTTLSALFEAARWAPSSFNEQPWRFIVGTRDGDPETYAKLLECLVPGNAAWAKTAPVLALSVARTTFTHNGVPNRVAFYDVGQAVGHLTAEAATRGLYLHQMGGYDIEKARAAFGIPEGYEPVAAIALGYLGDTSVLESEALQERHRRPGRPRRTLGETVFAHWEVPAPSLTG